VTITKVRFNRKIVIFKRLVFWKGEKRISFFCPTRSHFDIENTRKNKGVRCLVLLFLWVLKLFIQYHLRIKSSISGSLLPEKLIKIETLSAWLLFLQRWINPMPILSIKYLIPFSMIFENWLPLIQQSFCGIEKISWKTLFSGLLISLNINITSCLPIIPEIILRVHL